MWRIESVVFPSVVFPSVVFPSVVQIYRKSFFLPEGFINMVRYINVVYVRIAVLMDRNFPNPNFVFPIFPIFPGKYKKQVYKSGYEFVKQNISQVFISEIYFPISREI